MITYVHGDLFDLVKPGQVVIHNCNCQNTWGAGFAKRAQTLFPNAYQADMLTWKGHGRKLGQFTWADEEAGYTVVNVYGQYNYGRNRTHLSLEALHTALLRVNDFFRGSDIIMPRLGAGLAGGQWAEIELLVRTCLKDCQVTVVEYD